MFEILLNPTYFSWTNLFGSRPIYIATEIWEAADDDYVLVLRKNGALSFLHRAAIVNIRKIGATQP